MALILNAGTSSPSLQKLTKTGQTFQGTFTVTSGTVRLSAKYQGDDTYWELAEYKVR